MSVWKSDETLLSICILNFSFKNDFVWEEISNIRHSVSSPDETPRSSSKILRCASYFHSLLGVSSGDETLHLMFDILRIKLDGLETFSVCYVHQDVCTVVIHLFVLNRKVLKLSAFVMFIKTCVQKKIKGLLKMGTIQFFIPVSQDLTFS